MPTMPTQHSQPLRQPLPKLPHRKWCVTEMRQVLYEGIWVDCPASHAAYWLGMGYQIGLFDWQTMANQVEGHEAGVYELYQASECAT